MSPYGITRPQWISVFALTQVIKKQSHLNYVHVTLTVLLWQLWNSYQSKSHVLYLIQTFLYPPLQWSWKGGILVSHCPSFYPSICPSVCGQNRVRIVISTILAKSISYLHILSTSEGVSHAKSQNLNFCKFFKFVTLTLPCFDLGSDVNQYYG